MIAAVFPGQGSQKPGMGKALHDAAPWTRDVFKRVFDATGTNVAHLCFDADDETLRQTQNAQLALYACGVGAFEAMRERAPEVRFAAAAGHSVGEYAALTAAGILTVEQGARLVQKRGDLMARAGSLRPGTMAAVLGLEEPELAALCLEASGEDGEVVVANDNCPGQLVVSGDPDAVARLGQKATEAGARRVLPLNVSGAFHSPHMEEPAEALGEELRQTMFEEPKFPVFANVTSEAENDPQAWPALLEEQLRSRVRWTETIRTMRRQGIETFLEFGSGEVLGGLIRRIDPEAAALAIHDPASLEAAIEFLNKREVRA
jgi:[acyl-carrier-protein] S-malonyltransferase